MFCTQCGHRFAGTRATGRNETYRYYTCGSRQRYGASTCSADRLPAEALDSAIIEELLAAYDNSELFEDAVEEAHKDAQTGSRRLHGELSAVTLELTKVDASIDRYLRAFETGTMSASVCGESVKDLSGRATTLRNKREKLADLQHQAEIANPPSPAELQVLRDQIAEALSDGAPAVVKALLQALIHEIRVDSRNSIQPVFRVPLGTAIPGSNAVRAASRSVEVMGFEPTASTLRT